MVNQFQVMISQFQSNPAAVVSHFQDGQHQVCVTCGLPAARMPRARVCQCQSVSVSVPSVSAPISVSVRVSAVFTLCVDAAAVSQCVQHADSLDVGVCR